MVKRGAWFLLSLLLLTYVLYRWIAGLPVATRRSEVAIAVTVRNGERIFWGRGTCHVCHRVGTRGYATRAPDLGLGAQGPAIGIRADARAKRLGLPNGLSYLVQSLADPGAYVVSGFKNEMPEVFRAPIALSPSEIKAVILYLVSLGGDTLAQDIHLPRRVYAAYQKPEATDSSPRGNAEAGRRLFFDPRGPAACAACHVALDVGGRPRGGTIGPDLRAIANIRTAAYLRAKIVHPDSNVVSGYERVLLKTRQGRLLVGRIVERSRDGLVLKDQAGGSANLMRSEIASLSAVTGSPMPGNYAELLSREQLDDLLAYLLTLKADDPAVQHLTPQRALPQRLPRRTTQPSE